MPRTLPASAPANTLRLCVRMLRMHGVTYALMLCLILIGSRLIAGDRGFIDYLSQQREYKDAVSTLENVTAERLSLEYRVTRLRPDSLDVDLLEEEAKKTLSMTHPGERIILQ